MRSQSSFSTLYQYRSRTWGLFTSLMFSVIGDFSKKAFLKLCSVFLSFSFAYLFLIISFINFAAAIWKYRISVHLVANRQSWQWSVAYMQLCDNLVSTWGYLRYSANVSMWSRLSYILIWDTPGLLWTISMSRKCTVSPDCSLMMDIGSVSYTHLTLPTILLV